MIPAKITFATERGISDLRILRCTLAIESWSYCAESSEIGSEAMQSAERAAICQAYAHAYSEIREKVAAVKTLLDPHKKNKDAAKAIAELDSILALTWPKLEVGADGRLDYVPHT